VTAVLAPDRAPGLATARVLLDRERLSELVGEPVRATRLRHKPGLSTTAALVGDGPDGSRVLGWATVSHAGYRDKVSNAVRRAAERGRSVRVRPVRGEDDDLLLTTGPIDTDPRLHRALDALREVLPSVDDAAAAGRVTLLRYNPHRRLVLRLNRAVPVVVRATATRTTKEVDRLLRSLQRAGVPVLRPTRADGIPTTSRTSVWPWFGAGTLHAALPGASVRAAETGEALARLHRVAAGRSLPHWTPQAEEDTLAALVHDLARLDEGAAAVMGALAARVLDRLGEAPAVTSHGDFSGDQVLVDPWHGVRLTDLDRAAVAPAAADLGSFAAVELLTGGTDTGLTAPLREAYAAAGGTVVPEDAVRTWTARSLLHRVQEPFRAGEPDWPARVSARLAQVDEVLGR
jgi:hypothetical protein